ncbi:MAG TPA: RNA polymerase subunit sigma-24 [Micromonosporaceae bacterium]|nr:RNA polymerase subunit sigma-24 [Micromonosporaceae bacterium]HCU48689.1 RNA polymerase subunit sigma-24 [Micromonosporaceae bacterium]
MSGATDVFREHRRLLIGVAYRVLGSVTDAEDVVQESWLRWSKVDPREVNEPKAFLITTVTRLAIDRLRQVKAQREAYPGTWLPEPVSNIPGGAETAELADSVDLALLVVLETLSPLERAVFVLREAFELPFADIAEVIGREEPAARQLAKRAREHVQARRPRFEVDRASRREITERFLAASSQGDLDSLTSLLARDVALVSDGGGKARSPLRIIVGAEKVVRFFAGISTEQGTNAFMASIGLEPPREFSFAIAEINAAPALVVYAGSRPITLVSLVVADGRIEEIYLVANPEKLEHLTAA